MMHRRYVGPTAVVCLVAALAWPAAALSDTARWIGTWATAPQPFLPGALQTYANQTVRLIVRVSVGGAQARVRLSNTYGTEALALGAIHVARRTTGSDIDPSTDRPVTFGGKVAVTIAPGATVESDPVALRVPPRSDVAVSLFFPTAAAATTSHSLALQTGYVSADGDVAGDAKIRVSRTITSWPFLTGVDVVGTADSASIVALGSSTTDGDGSTTDRNQRWPDLLAERLQRSGGRRAQLGVLNLGIIGNRLLHDSPHGADNPFGAALGEAGIKRFDRDVLAQAGVKYVMFALGINDIGFPAFPFTPPDETVTADDLIAGFRQLVKRAREKKLVVIGTTMPPFEHSAFTNPAVSFFTPAREAIRQRVNDWIRQGGGFDGVVDFDAVVRDPARPTQLLPAYDSGDHLHVNDAGNVAAANAIPLTLFDRR